MSTTGLRGDEVYGAFAAINVATMTLRVALTDDFRRRRRRSRWAGRSSSQKAKAVFTRANAVRLLAAARSRLGGRRLRELVRI